MIRRRMPAVDDRSIIRLIRTELIPISHAPDSRMSRLDYIRRMQRGRTYVWRPRGRRCQGFIHVLLVRPNVWIDLLAVEPQARGQGIGSAMLQASEHYGRSLKAAAVCLFVDRSNRKAIRFYERNGYAITAYVPATQCYRMEKPLG